MEESINHEPTIHRDIVLTLSISSFSSLPQQYLFRAMYMRKVNPNRVNLSTEIMMDNEGNNTVAVGAEYQLKQSKISFSVDSTLVIKSTVESNLSPGVQFQLSAEMAQAKEHYRFGYGLIMG
jgi:hypothetical protein